MVWYACMLCVCVHVMDIAAKSFTQCFLVTVYKVSLCIAISFHCTGIAAVWDILSL